MYIMFNCSKQFSTLGIVRIKVKEKFEKKI